MLNAKMTDNAHAIISQHLAACPLQKGVAVDATLGHGKDLAFLTALPQLKTFYAFDIQEQAFNQTKQLFETVPQTIHWILDNHVNLDKYITEPIGVAMFNLGYLPNGDKKIVTQAEETIGAIQKVLDRLVLNGIVSIMTYPGHDLGKIEHEAVEKFLTTCTQKELEIFHLSRINTLTACPNLFIIIKRS
jgi:hypothetical protein